MKFIEMPKELQTKSIETLSLNYGMPEQIIEKDWWVSTVMRALFALPYANQMSFKGCDIAVSATGIAGPDSDDRGNPVGLVYLGLAYEDQCVVKEFHAGKVARERVRR